MASRWNDDDEWDRARDGRSGRFAIAVVAGVVIYIAGVFSGAWLRPNIINSVSNSGQQQSQPAQSNSTSSMPPELNGNSIAAIYKNSISSIVTITALHLQSAKDGSQADIGTGFLIDSKGDLATNDHVVSGQSTVSVTLAGKTYTGSVVGTDPLDDLAVVRVAELAGKKPLPLGTDANLEPGDTVVAIGNPFELTGSVSAGIVSGLNRSMPSSGGRVISGLVQTDAALNPGNSGGPLLNSQGQVIGINTAIESPVEGSVGIGFAIPIDRFRQVMSDLVSGKQVAHPYLGISALDIDAVVQQVYHLPVSEGVLVVSVAKNSPAAKAGIHGDTGGSKTPKGDGDIITKINGTPVNSVADLTAQINRYAVGTKITVTVIRAGKTMELSLVLGSWNNSGS